MELWGWLVLAFVALALGRLLAAVVRGESEQLTVAGEGVVAPPGSPPAATAAGECSHCGAENDPAYTYCRNCARQL